LKLKDFKNIAIIQTAFIGDVALSFYLIQNIKNYHTNSKLFFVTTPVSSSLASCINAIDNIITFDKRNRHSGLKGIKNISSILKELKIECIIAPHRSFRTALVTFLSKPSFSVGFDKSSFSFLYSKRVKWRLSKHEIERNNSLLVVFDDTEAIVNKIPEIEINLDENDVNYVDNLLSKNEILLAEKKIIGLAPGSVWPTKRWKIEYYSELSIRLTNSGFNVIIIGSKEDFLLGEIIRKSNFKVLNLCGQTNLPQLLYLMKSLNVLVTNDSSPTHIAGLVKTPTITIFGPTSSKFGFSPIGEKDKIVELDDLNCRPCSIHGQHKCPLKHHNCMGNIKPDSIFNLVQEIIRA